MVQTPKARPADGPRFLLGPVLVFRGEQGDRWRVSALFVIDGDQEPDDLRVDGVGLPVPPRHVAAWRGKGLWRFDFAVPRGGADGEAAYGFEDGEERWTLAVPARGGAPRLAYTGGGGDGDGWPWSGLAAQHARAPFHLLLQGGGQPSARTAWRDCPSLAAWRKGKGRPAGPFTATMAEEAMSHCVDRSIALWSRPDVAPLLAHVPSVMIWDGHDPFGGWDPPSAATPQPAVARGVALVARRAFAMFQLAAEPESLPECVWGAAHGGFTQGFRVGDLGLLAPDLHSDRRPDRALSERVWAALPEWLERFQGCRHLLFLAGVPLHHAGAGTPWCSPEAQEDWRRLLERLASFSLRSGCRISTVSGGARFGARALLNGGGVAMWQLASTGAGRPPPGRLATALRERQAARSVAPFPGWSQEIPAFPESGRRLIRARNWLSVHLDRASQLHIQWQTEGNADRFVQTI